MKSIRVSFALIALVVLAASPLSAGPLDPAVQAKVDAQVKAIQAWAGDPAIVAAVKAQNASPSADVTAMTQEKWATLSVLDPAVRGFAKNDAAAVLKAKKTDAISEAFVSSADGRKVAFIAKTTSFSHKGKPKHDVPMTGKTWQGAVEVDESTGVQQLQVAVPVMDGGKAIGSLVVGLSLAKL
jgi:hypothetical protein